MPPSTLTLPLTSPGIDLPHGDSPNWAEQLTGWGTIALVIVTALPLIATAYNLRQGRQGQQELTFLEMTRRWNDQTFRRARIRIRRIYELNQDPNEVRDELLALRRVSRESYWECVEVVNFFETLAVLVKSKALKITTVERVWAFIVWDYYSILFKFIQYQRDQPPKDDTFGAEFKWLADLISGRNDYAKVWDQMKDDEQGVRPGPTK